MTTARALSLRLTARQLIRLEREAKRLSVSVAEVVRRLLDAWIDEGETKR